MEILLIQSSIIRYEYYSSSMLYFNTSTGTIYAYDMAQITQYAIDYSRCQVIIYISDSVNIDNSYNEIIVLQSLATQISYTPSSELDWINNFGTSSKHCC